MASLLVVAALHACIIKSHELTYFEGRRTERAFCSLISGWWSRSAQYPMIITLIKRKRAITPLGGWPWTICLSFTSHHLVCGVLRSIVHCCCYPTRHDYPFVFIVKIKSTEATTTTTTALITLISIIVLNSTHQPSTACTTSNIDKKVFPVQINYRRSGMLATWGEFFKHVVVFLYISRSGAESGFSSIQNALKYLLTRAKQWHSGDQEAKVGGKTAPLRVNIIVDSNK